MLYIYQACQGFCPSFFLKAEEAKGKDPSFSRFSRDQVIGAVALAALAALSTAAAVSLRRLNPNLQGGLLSLALLQIVAIPLILFPPHIPSDQADTLDGRGDVCLETPSIGTNSKTWERFDL